MTPLTAEQVWWERLQRAMEREGPSAAVRDLAHEMLGLREHSPRLMRRAEDGSHAWVPNPAAGDEAATERALAELLDRFGERLGVGPRPR